MSSERANPYVGPRAFETNETIYGRSRELRMLSAQLISERVVLLHSPSGAGKTSLIRAGLIPLLREENFHVLPVVRVNLEPGVEITRQPGFNRYAYSVIAALEESLPPEQRRPLPALACLSLDAYLSQRPRPADAPRSEVLLFDQFEEVLTIAPTDREGKQAFFAQLGAALRNSSRWALFAMREDYIGAVAPYVRPLPNRFEVTFRLDLLGVEAALQAIQSPAREAGVEFNDAAARKLVDDLRRVQVQLPDGSVETVLGEHIEPVQMQVVCYRLWQNRGGEDTLIDLDDIAAVGNVDQSLGEYYAASVQHAAAQTGLNERALREWFETKLITKEGIRGQVLMGAETSEGLDNRAARLLENAHIIRAEKRAGATWFELAHDRLIQPVRQNNAAWFEQNLSLFQRQAALWAQQGRPEGLLLRGKEFRQVEEGSGPQISGPQKLTVDETDFLNACRRLHAQERLRRGLMTSVVVLLVVAVAAVVLSFFAYNLAVARSVVTAGRVALAENNPRQAALLALQARQIANIPEADALLGDATDQVEAINSRGFMGHRDKVLSVAWSADGRLASGSWDGTIIIWDLASGAPLQTLRAPGGLVNCVAWSADGRLASVSADGPIIIWDLSSGKPAQILNQYVLNINNLAWTTDGRLAARIGSAIIIWDLTSGKPVQTVETLSAIDDTAWSADGRLAITDGYDQTYNHALKVWDLASGQAVQALQGISTVPESIAWARDGRVAAGMDDGTIIIWDMNSGAMIHTLRGDSGKVSTINWSPDGRFVSASEDGAITLWDLENGTPAQTLQGHAGAVNAMAWSAGGLLASGHENGAITLWDLRGKEPAAPGKSVQILTMDPSGVSDIAWSADGRLATAADKNEEKIIIWDLESGKPVQTLQENALDLAWSADGRLATLAGNGDIVTWDLESGEPTQTLQGHAMHLAWSADGRLASASQNDVTIWDLESSTPAQTLRGHTEIVSDLAWSADGRLASGSQDGTIILWDLESSTPAQALRGHTEIVFSLAWSADGRLASGSRDRTIIVWDLGSGKPAHTLRGYSGGTLDVSWSPDGRLTAGSVGVWAEDGRTLIGEDEKTLIIWDLTKNPPVKSTQEHSHAIYRAAWSPDGRLALGSKDGTITVLQNDVTGPACSWVARNLKVSEWIDTAGPLYAYHPTCPNLPGDVVSFPKAVEWQEWQAQMIKNKNTLFDYRHSAPRFLWLTWPGRWVLIGLVLLLLTGVTLIIQASQGGSFWWAAGTVIAGILLAVVALALRSVLAMLLGLVVITSGHLGLLARFIARGYQRRKIALAVLFVLADALLLIVAWIEMMTNASSYSTGQFALFLAAGSYLAQLVWLVILGSRRLARKRTLVG